MELLLISGVSALRVSKKRLYLHPILKHDGVLVDMLARSSRG